MRKKNPAIMDLISMDKNKKYGLTKDSTRAIISVLSENQRIDKVILFGSRAKGENESGSDIDLALLGEKLNLDDILNARIELDEILFPYKTDLVIYERIKEKELKEHIDRVGIVLYERGNK